MAKRKEQTVACAVCGKIFTAFGNRAKYCLECAEKRASYQRAMHNAKRRENKTADDKTYHFCDNHEQIQACLNCKEKFCSGERCQINKSLGNKHAGRHKLESGTREKVISLRANGLLHREIAERLGISASTVGRFLKQTGGN